MVFSNIRRIRIYGSYSWNQLDEINSCLKGKKPTNLEKRIIKQSKYSQVLQWKEETPVWKCTHTKAETRWRGVCDGKRRNRPSRKTKDIDNAFLMQMTKLGHKARIHGRQWRSPLLRCQVSLYRGAGRGEASKKLLRSITENFPSGKETIGK